MALHSFGNSVILIFVARCLRVGLLKLGTLLECYGKDLSDILLLKAARRADTGVFAMCEEGFRDF